MSRRDPMQHFRLPLEIVTWIDHEAKDNERSKNAQIVFVFKQAMKKASDQPGSNSDASTTE